MSPDAWELSDDQLDPALLAAMLAGDPLPDASDGLDASPGGTPAARGLPVGVTGADLLDQVHDFGCRFVAWPSPEAAVAWAAWVAHAHLLDHCDSTPRLAVVAPEKQSGKTRVLEVTETLVPRPMRSASTTTAVLFRLIGTDKRPTVMLDEADTLWSEKGANEELRALINAGHRRGSDVHRMTGEGSKMRATTFASFAAVALAGIGDLPDTLMDRSVVLRMRRRASHEQVERWRFRHGQAEGAVLARMLAAWAAGIDELSMPEDVDDITDRVMDVWEPLFAVADVAGGRWPVAVRDACRVLSAANPADTSLRLRVLDELREVWPTGETFVSTAALLDKLHKLEDSPWGPGGPFGANGLSPHTLGRLLGNYGVRSKHSADRSHRGYLLHDLADPWDRYLTPVPPAREASKASEAPERCPHGVPAGDQPDEFVGGRLGCTLCRAEAVTR